VDLRRLADGLRETNTPTSRAVGWVRWVHARPGAALLVLAAVASSACAPDDAAPVETRIAAASAPDAAGPPNLDLLFVIDNGPGMAPMQAKLVDQIPSMMRAWNGMPAGSPSVHVAVISTDMGAHSDRPDQTGCSETGDQGAFQAQARGTCTDVSLLGDTTFLSTGGGPLDDATVGTLSGVVQCMLPLGEGGCPYAHPLAAVARALGADGMPAPASNAGFLRPDAMLAIVILTSRDDCSAASPEITALYSLNGGPDAVHNGLGPLTTYRCNEWGHLCVDPQTNSAANVPPEAIPTDAMGTPSAPTLDLTNCTSNPGGLLMPVQTFVDEIRALKPDRERQVIVGLISGPVSPYTVAWVPANDPNAPAGELWPEVEHSCGAAGALDTNPNATDLATDGSFGDPSVRLTQFAGKFGTNGMTGSVCYPNYGTTMAPLTALIAAKLSEFPYLTGTGTDAGGTASLDGAAPLGDGGPASGGGGSSGAGPSGSAGASGGGGHGGVSFNGKLTGLQSGCVCSVGTAATPGPGLVLLLIAPAILRRRSRRGRKKLT
jgi:hypothetical protein